MFRTNNLIFAIGNCLTLTIGIGLIFFSINAGHRHTSKCQRSLQFPIFWTGLVMSVLALLGVICSFCNTDKLLFVFVAFVFFWTIGLIISAIIFISLTNVGHHGKPFHLDEANSLQKGFFKDINWQRFKTCFVERGICNVTTNVAVDPVHNPVQVNYVYKISSTFLPVCFINKFFIFSKFLICTILFKSC